MTKKYDGLDGTELAISESQERMACAVADGDVEEFMGYAAEENLEATVIAEVTAEPRMRMAWNGVAIVDLSREFLNSNGAPKHRVAHVCARSVWQPSWAGTTLAERMTSLVTDLNVASNKGPFRALRLHHRRRDRAHALWRQDAAHPQLGHGRQVPRGRRDHHGECHGMGLQPLSDGGRPVCGRLPVRGRVHRQARGCRL